MKTLQCLTLMSLVVISGCAPAVHRGSVAMKIGDNEAHVCLGNDEVVPGDKVTYFRNVCTPSNAGTKPVKPTLARCEKKRIGTGTIKSVLNEHYSVASIDGSFEYREGDIVEKVSR